MKTPQLEDGYIRIANEIWDALISHRIAGVERQCLDFILRKTYGFNKKEDYISNSQFCKATGLKKVAVCKAITQLIAKNIVTKNGNTRIPSYCFNKNYKSWKLLPKKVTVTNIGNAVTKNDNKQLPKMVPTKDNTKNNIQKTKKGNGVFKLHNEIPEIEWNNYMQVRARIKCANTDGAKQLLVNKLLRFKSQGYCLKQVLEEATEKSWKSVYEPKEKQLDEFGEEVDPKLEKWRKANAKKKADLSNNTNA